MEFTGERPTTEDASSIQRSKDKYKTAIKFIKEYQNILDFGCGVGLGYEVLNKLLNPYVGVDLSKEAIEEASKNYMGSFHQIESINDLCHIVDITGVASLDFFLALEVIEHLELQEAQELLHIIKRYPQDKITGYISTPNGDYYKYHPKPEERVGFHKWHYTYKELTDLFSIFKHYEIFGLEYVENLNQFLSYGVYFEK